MLYFNGFAFVRDLENCIAAGLRPGGYIVFGEPLPTPEQLLERSRPWHPLGLTPIGIEYRSEPADWRQPFSLACSLKVWIGMMRFTQSGQFS
jgi:hypothetical protein